MGGLESVKLGRDKDEERRKWYSWLWGKYKRSAKEMGV